MKLLTTLCLLLIVAVPAVAQKRRASLTRAETREAERLLDGLGYWTGPVDGVFDPATRFALIAFQKWEQRPLTGRLTIDEIEAMRSATTPVPKIGRASCRERV